MPYAGIEQLPAQVRDHLPVHAQRIYMEAFNSAWERYREPRTGAEVPHGKRRRIGWRGRR